MMATGRQVTGRSLQVTSANAFHSRTSPEGRSPTITPELGLLQPSAFPRDLNALMDVRRMTLPRMAARCSFVS